MDFNKKDTVLLFSSSEIGGIAEYNHAQAVELSRRCIRCIVLCSKGFLPDRCAVDYEQKSKLVRMPSMKAVGIYRKIALAAIICIQRYQLIWFIIKIRPKFVIIDAPTELLSYLWAWPHIFASRIFRVKYVVNIGDPQRKRIVGPEWLHSLSVWLSYSFVSAGLIHYIGESRPKWIPGHVKLIEVPMGPLRLSLAPVSRDRFRAERGFADDIVLFLSFGHIVDRKNISLFIDAMRQFSRVGLLVAGSTGSSRDKSGSYYRALADEYGIGERVVIEERFIPSGEVAAYFEAADIIALPYNASFISQSGVPYLALHWDKPMLVSAGPGPLLRCVERYQLGLIVEPDSEEALRGGICKMLMHEFPLPDWQGFRRDETWERNIDLLLNYTDHL